MDKFDDYYDSLFKRIKTEVQEEEKEQLDKKPKRGRPRKGEAPSFDYEHYKENIRRAVLKYQQSDPIRYLYQAARAVAKKKDLDFCIDVSDIMLPDVCPVIKCALTFERGKGRVLTNAVLDRIDRTKGFTKDNILVVSSLGAELKNDFTREEIIKLAEGILEFYKNL